MKYISLLTLVLFYVAGCRLQAPPTNRPHGTPTKTSPGRNFVPKLATINDMQSLKAPITFTDLGLLAQQSTPHADPEKGSKQGTHQEDHTNSERFYVPRTAELCDDKHTWLTIPVRGNYAYGFRMNNAAFALRSALVATLVNENIMTKSWENHARTVVLALLGAQITRSLLTSADSHKRTPRRSHVAALALQALALINHAFFQNISIVLDALEKKNTTESSDYATLLSLVRTFAPFLPTSVDSSYDLVDYN